jgi:hypothetical protein
MAEEFPKRYNTNFFRIIAAADAFNRPKNLRYGMSF